MMNNGETESQEVQAIDAPIMENDRTAGATEIGVETNDPVVSSRTKGHFECMEVKTMSASPELAGHPAAAILRNMSDTEYQQLKDDIHANGLLEPIVLRDNLILDGRHRYRACLELAIEPRFETYDGDDPFGFVVSRNVCRRQLHLNASQRALIAAGLADMKPGGNRSTPQTSGLTHAKAAAKLNVGKRSVDAASALKNGVDAGRVDREVLELVHKGELSLAKAVKVAGMPKDQQLVAAAQKGRNRTVAGAPRRKPLARLTDEAVRRSEECGDTMEQVAWRVRTRTASKLARERYDQLIAVWNRLNEHIEMQIGWLEEARDRSFDAVVHDSSAA